MSKNMKPYRLDHRKATKPILTNIDIAQWREMILANFEGEDAAEKAAKLDRMLTFIAINGYIS